MTMNLMKPICDPGTDVVSRSHNGDTVRSSAFSSSPCAKNSARTSSVHFLASGRGRAAFDMSETCRQNFNNNCMSLTSHSSAGVATKALRAATFSKCAVMSVAKIMGIAICRNSMRWSIESGSRMFSRCSSWNRTEQWWFSSTEMSLWRRASSVCVLTWKALLRPSCSTSCAAAERSNVSTCRSPMPLSSVSPPCRQKNTEHCTMSAACTLVWYGLLWT
mmetsp:Transcript_26122/g.60309  ORF Transcript_26122/g.60309 Transcript_26122/m.60309 type:complete len:219 (-) Transcript_26122:935-1591(-)